MATPRRARDADDNVDPDVSEDSPGPDGGDAGNDAKGPAGKGAASAPRRALERSRRHPVRTAGLVAGVVVVLLAVVALVAVFRLQGNISAIDITDQIGTDRPSGPEATGNHKRAFPGSLTIAVFGDDTRDGDNDFVGGDKGAGRSDTTLVVHLNEARTQIQVVSIPRDSMVQRPSCTKADGTKVPPALEPFNAAYTHGGPACSIRTIEKLTGVRIDQYVVVDFTGFRKIVDAVDGVEICVSEPIKDSDSGLDLPAGRTTLDGDEALAFVRTRHAVGDGSDLARIKLQQQFLRALASKVRSMNLVTDAPRLYGFLDATTSALTTSPDLARIDNLVGLAREVQQIPDEQIIFKTVPTGAYPADPNRVQWTAEADELWAAMRKDKPFPGTKTPGGSGSAGPSGTPSGSASPSSSSSPGSPGSSSSGPC